MKDSDGEQIVKMYQKSASSQKSVTLDNNERFSS